MYEHLMLSANAITSLPCTQQEVERACAKTRTDAVVSVRNF